MRIVTKKELLELPPYTLFRKWTHDVYLEDEWNIKTGKDFGAYSLSPDTEKSLEDLEPIWDWDGNLDLEDGSLYAVAEREDIQRMQDRLSLVMQKCDFETLKATGKEPWEV